MPKNIQSIEVYYDGHCGMCCTFHEWLSKQNRAYAVYFIPYQSAHAEERFPGINNLAPEREMIVRIDAGKVYRGAEGWVLCLMSCKKYQGIARRLTSPILMPMAEKTCHALAARRHGLSKIFFRKKDKEVSSELHNMSIQTCNEGCQISSKQNIPDGVI